MADENQNPPNDTGSDRQGSPPAESTQTNPVADAAGDAEAALDAADQAAASIGSDVGKPPDDTSGATKFEVPEFAATTPAAGTDSSVDLLGDVNLNVKIELGRTQMLVDDVLKLSEGAVVELDKLAGDPVDVFVNDRHIARGEVLVLNDNFCVRVNEIIDPIEDKPSRT